MRCKVNNEKVRVPSQLDQAKGRHPAVQFEFIYSYDGGPARTSFLWTTGRLQGANQQQPRFGSKLNTPSLLFQMSPADGESQEKSRRFTPLILRECLEARTHLPSAV